MEIAGLDIGNKGGFSIIREVENLPNGFRFTIDSFRMPTYEKKIGTKKRVNIDYDELFNILNKELKENDVLVIEDINVIFGVAKYTSFIMGYQKGIIEGYCKVKNIDLVKVRSAEWQRYMFDYCKQELEFKDIDGDKKGKTKLKTKKLSVGAVQWLIDNGKLRLNIDNVAYQNIPVTYDGITDSVLLAIYYYQTQKYHE